MGVEWLSELKKREIVLRYQSFLVETRRLIVSSMIQSLIMKDQIGMSMRRESTPKLAKSWNILPHLLTEGSLSTASLEGRNLLKFTREWQTWKEAGGLSPALEQR